MATKFTEFLTEKKIDPRRIRIASQHVEGLQPEDRTIRLKRRLARKSEEAAEAAKKEERKKPRSGRPVTDRSLKAALAGKAITGPQKTRLLRAVNRILEQRKQEPVNLRVLF